MPLRLEVRGGGGALRSRVYNPAVDGGGTVAVVVGNGSVLGAA